MAKASRYAPQEIEQKWYKHWLANDYFRSTPDEREPYTIVIPPPNVTGVLHMGHMLNNTIQDIYIRKARLEGKNACWVPGTDHASIATEAKVVKKLREQGTSKAEVGRDQFLKEAFQWKEKYGGIILKQLERLGASCDWSRTRFTMEESLSEAVIHVFVDLHKKGHLYRGLRMTNWDPQAQTVLSNEEVIHNEENGHLYHVRYEIEGQPGEYLSIATTRPETILGDTAIAVHPDDERYQHLRGKQAIVPMVNRAVPIIFDDYVDLAFGTGALKVTPAHDMNDYDIGQRHGLETIDVLNADGSMSEAAQFYIGMDRHETRKRIAKDLDAKGHLVKVEDYRNKVGRSERTGAVVEPRLTMQWFLHMESFAKTALEVVEEDEVRFYPTHFKNMYRSWLREENVRDWCISRQLWWGQRIPAWFYDGQAYVATTAEEALAQAQQQTGKSDLTLDDLQQDEDVVDTWFSSWLWPITVFDGFKNPDELKYYYPTNLLVTGWDIMFLWVARMIMAGYEWSADLLGEEMKSPTDRRPFKDVFFTGMVRDEKRKKMSKSLGNSPDAIALLDRYGADGVRFGLLSSAAAGNDIIFDAPMDPDTGKVLNESRMCDQGLNFCNKMWNALRLIKNWEVDDAAAQPLENAIANEWFTATYQKATEQLQQEMDSYRISDAMMRLYAIIWDDFCSWYLEMIKPAYQQPVDEQTRQEALTHFEKLMTLLHPFMPFVTEEIWHQLRERAAGDDCVISSWPAIVSYDEAILKQIDTAKQIISRVRDNRNKYGLKKSEPLPLYVPEAAKYLIDHEGLRKTLEKVGVINELILIDAQTDIENAISFIVGADKFFIAIQQEIDTEAEAKRLKEELDYQRGFLQSVKKKLQNQGFVNNAPEKVVAMERKKEADAEARIQAIQESLAELGGA